MAITNNERVGKALDALRDGIRPSCEQSWQAKYGADWIAVVQERDNHGQGVGDPNDLAWLLKGMHNTWQEVWKFQFGPTERSYSGELRTVRNKWAHQEQFSSDDTYRALDTAERLLQAFGAVAQVKSVQDLKRELQRLTFEEQARSQHRKAAAKPTEGEPQKGLAPWRDVITPHADVASGRFEQAEFAADLYQVANASADPEYLDPVAFFERTYLTNGLKELLVGAARRLNGDGGDPVIDLQTNFGGGKTHSMIALYHLASGVPATDLPGVGEVLSEEGLSLPSSVARAVVVGQWISPAAPTVKSDGTKVHTLWGEIAYQLAGAEGYALVEESDKAGTNPGDQLEAVFRLAGPSVVLIDEWVAYARQLPSREGEPRLVGGDFDTQFTFAQLLTEAAAACDNVVVLVSIPASDIEVGGDKGQDALARLSNVVRRKSAQWKPADDDESFEIVRRRLFEPMSPDQMKVRDGVIRAFSEYYNTNKKQFPNEVVEADYRRRMELSYPIHPELFDRLYRDWSTLDRFQRTRGVLRLMATVISVLWQRDDKNLLIMPGTIPLDESRVNSELTKYLEDGWDPVIRSDVDGPNALPLKIDQEQPALGRYSACRRVARTVYLASAPRTDNNRGLDVKLISLGSAQPGESPGKFADALRHLSDAATFLYQDKQQYWYSLQANVTRLAADRASSNFSDDDADDEIRRRLRTVGSSGPFSALHACPDGPGDVTDDDDGVHLVVLPPTAPHVPGAETSPAISLSIAILAQRQAGPRLNRNLLIFCAASEPRLNDLREVTRQHLAWGSILEDAKVARLELSAADASTAKSKFDETSGTIEDRIAETYLHVLVPTQVAGTPDITWHQTKPSGAGSLAERIGTKLASEERLIVKYGGTRVRMDLDRIPLWTDRGDVAVSDLWKAYSQFPYLPRLASFQVLADAISDGTCNPNWVNDSFAYADGHDGNRWVGLSVVQLVDARPGGFVVSPAVARPQVDAEADGVGPTGDDGDGHGDDDDTGGDPPQPDKPGVALPRRFYARFGLDDVRAIRQLEDIMREVAERLKAAPGGSVELTLEVNAESDGFDATVQRVVKENSDQLGAENYEFE